jgi:transcriptional regulator
MRWAADLLILDPIDVLRGLLDADRGECSLHMYNPPHYREDDLGAMHEVIRRHAFGVVVSSGAEGLEATHLPLLLDENRGPYGTLVGHMARANPQWRILEQASEVVSIFSGPHTYISPSWYVNPEAVPTWNYIAVHAHGRAKLLPDDALRGLLARMVHTYEHFRPQPWTMESVPETYLAGRLKGIVGFEIEITRLHGKKKLGQNRSREDRQAVVQALERSQEPDDLAIARWMRQTLGEG